MIKEFPLPDLGEGLTESEIVAWRVAVGDRVELNQIIADVETAKAVVELPSPYAGVITALHAAEGETIDVGAPLFSCDTGGPDVESDVPAATPETSAEAVASAEAAASAMQASLTTPAVDTADAAPGPNLVGYGAAAESGPKRRARAGLHSSPVATAPVETEATHIAAHDATVTEVEPLAERPRSTPPVRKLARDLGVDLESVTGTGERGLITRDDVEAAASASPSSERVSARSESVGEFVPESTRTVDVTATMQLLRGIRDDRAFSGHKVTPLAVVAKALCIAARRTPEVNARWDEDAQEIVQFGGVNLGIAAATERGLVVPNIKGAESMTLVELADAITLLADTARAGRTQPADLGGGTISITNIGVFGIDAGTPILNPGEAAILAMGAVRRQPWEYQGEIALRELMTLSLSFDHRLVDGAQGSRFLADIGAILREPGIALTMA
jgi:2-oxoisovalerate dehydrogenase E2 component (dihydrolipoyl transacylase)